MERKRSCFVYHPDIKGKRSQNAWLSRIGASNPRNATRDHSKRHEYEMVSNRMTHLLGQLSMVVAKVSSLPCKEWCRIQSPGRDTRLCRSSVNLWQSVCSSSRDTGVSNRDIEKFCVHWKSCTNANTSFFSRKTRWHRNLPWSTFLRSWCDSVQRTTTHYCPLKSATRQPIHFRPKCSRSWFHSVRTDVPFAPLSLAPSSLDIHQFVIWSNRFSNSRRGGRLSERFKDSVLHLTRVVLLLWRTDDKSVYEIRRYERPRWRHKQLQRQGTLHVQRSCSIPTVAPANLSWVPSTRTRVNNSSKFHSFHSYANIPNGSCGTFSIPQGNLHTKTISNHAKPPSDSCKRVNTLSQDKRLQNNDWRTATPTITRVVLESLRISRTGSFGRKSQLMVCWSGCARYISSLRHVRFLSATMDEGRGSFFSVSSHIRDFKMWCFLSLEYPTRSSVHACHQLKKGVSSCTRCRRKMKEKGKNQSFSLFTLACGREMQRGCWCTLIVFEFSVRSLSNEAPWLPPLGFVLGIFFEVPLSWQKCTSSDWDW